MPRTLVAPGTYVQGRDVLSTADTYGPLGADAAFVLGGTTALSTARSALVSGLEAAGIEVAGVEDDVNACTFADIDALAEAATAVGADLVVGVGGGVALDTAKGVAERIGAELAVVPTIASTDAPCSSVAVVYDEAGGFDGYIHRDDNPELVAVDVGVVAAAPARFLRYGMGDALATRFEAEAVFRADAETHAGGRPTTAALALARRAYETLDRSGAEALGAVERDAVTPAVESVVEANTLLSGLGFESGGLAAAHAFGKGFSRAGVKQPHGLLIAFGTVAQLVLEDREERTLEEVLDLAAALGLDNDLADLEVPLDRVDEVAAGACREDTTMSNLPRSVTVPEAADALRAADTLLGGR